VSSKPDCQIKSNRPLVKRLNDTTACALSELVQLARLELSTDASIAHSLSLAQVLQRFSFTVCAVIPLAMCLQLLQQLVFLSFQPMLLFLEALNELMIGPQLRPRHTASGRRDRQLLTRLIQLSGNFALCGLRFRECLLARC
jgi:hypothetical protein